MPETEFESIAAHLEPAYSDVRGDITNILSGEEAASIQHIAIITSAKGSIRGNHRHPAAQYLYILSGRMRSYSGLRGRRRVLLIKAGDLVYCPPNVPHAYLAREDTVFLNLDCATRGNYSVDTTPYVLLESPP